MGPVFIVGMNGSGTTMLLDSMGRHSALYAFPRETRIMPHYLVNTARFGDLNNNDVFRKLWDEVRSAMVFRYVNSGEAMPLPEDWQHTPRTVAGIFDRLFRQFAARDNKTRWCEKTPQHVQHIKLLAQAYPDALFIHMIRDGRDSAVSFYRRWLRTPEMTIFRWKKAVTEGRKQGAQLGARYFELKYEELTADPERCLRAICEFLNVPFEPVILESSQPYLEKKASGQGGITRNSGKWQSAFAPQRCARLESIAGATLAQCGYDTNQPTSDVDPPKWQREWWMLRDQLRQFMREISSKSRGDIKRPWWVILSKPLVALRQRRTNKF